MDRMNPRNVQQLDVRNGIARAALDAQCVSDLVIEATRTADALERAAKVLRECGRHCFAIVIEHQAKRQRDAIARAEGRVG